jgi:hypothetical protein
MSKEEEEITGTWRMKHRPEITAKDLPDGVVVEGTNDVMYNGSLWSYIPPPRKRPHDQTWKCKKCGLLRSNFETHIHGVGLKATEVL